MFCGKCGNQLPDGVAFCPSCGNATGAQPKTQPQAQAQVQAQPQMQYNPQMQAAPAKKKVSTNTIIGVAAVAFVVIAIVVALILILGGGGSKGGAKTAVAAAEGFYNAYLDQDVDTMLDYIHEDVVKEAADENYDGSVKELKEDLAYELENEYAMIDEAEITFAIVGSEEYDEDDFEELKDVYLDKYDLKLSSAMIVNYELTIKGTAFGEELDTTSEHTVIVVKIGGKWFVEPANAF